MKEALESFLPSQMLKLCADGDALNAVDMDACREFEKLGLFEITTPLAQVARTLGAGRVSAPRIVEGAAESMRLSIEHRYALLRWPAYEFVILESELGVAWGHTFARRAGSAVPPIRQVNDVARWSHLESEVRAALGAPISRDEWFPWESATYRFAGGAFSLCFVYGLLQRVRAVDEHN